MKISFPGRDVRTSVDACRAARSGDKAGPGCSSGCVLPIAPPPRRRRGTPEPPRCARTSELPARRAQVLVRRLHEHRERFHAAGSNRVRPLRRRRRRLLGAQFSACRRRYLWKKASGRPHAGAGLGRVRPGRSSATGSFRTRYASSSRRRPSLAPSSADAREERARRRASASPPCVARAIASSATSDAPTATRDAEEASASAGERAAPGRASPRGEAARKRSRARAPRHRHREGARARHGAAFSTQKAQPRRDEDEVARAAGPRGREAPSPPSPSSPSRRRRLRLFPSDSGGSRRPARLVSSASGASRRAPAEAPGRPKSAAGDRDTYADSPDGVRGKVQVRGGEVPRFEPRRRAPNLRCRRDFYFESRGRTRRPRVSHRARAVPDASADGARRENKKRADDEKQSGAKKRKASSKISGADRRGSGGRDALGGAAAGAHEQRRATRTFAPRGKTAARRPTRFRARATKKPSRAQLLRPDAARWVRRWKRRRFRAFVSGGAMERAVALLMRRAQKSAGRYACGIRALVAGHAGGAGARRRVGRAPGARRLRSGVARAGQGQDAAQATRVVLRALEGRALFATL